MTFLRILPRFSRNQFQVLQLSLLALLLVSLVSGCSDPDAPEGSAEGEAVTETNTSPVKIPVVTVESETAKPASKPSVTVAKEVKKRTSPESKAVVAETPEVKVPAVKFPEMKMSDHATTVRELFVAAQKQFTEKRYVGAIQTLRKLDSMELVEKEEQAVDMFLKRIEKALGSQGKAAAESSEE